MSNNTPDYEDNLFFEPITCHIENLKAFRHCETTERLKKQLEIAKDFIFRCANDISGDWYINSAKCVLQKIEELDK